MNAIEALNSITLANVYKSKFGGIQADIVAFNDAHVPLGKSIKVHIAPNVPTYADPSYAGKIKLLLPLSGVTIRKLDKSSYLIESGPYNLFGVAVRTGNFSLKNAAVNSIKLTWPATVDSWWWKDTYGLILTPDNKICVHWKHWCSWKLQQGSHKSIDLVVAAFSDALSTPEFLSGECHIDLAGRVDIKTHNEPPPGCAQIAAGCVLSMLALIVIAILFVVLLGIIAGAIAGFKEALAFTCPSISAVGNLT